MSFNNILSIFLPKDVVFFGLFENVAENIQIMGAQFRLFVEESDPIKRLEIFKQIEELEHQNDAVQLYHLSYVKNHTILIQSLPIYFF